MGKMKDSSLLKWTQNNKNNKLVGNKEKKEKKSKEEKNKNWLHTPENLTSGHIAYLVKFLGSTEVDQPKGIEVVKEGIRKLKFNQQIKKAEGTKTPKVELTVSVDGVAIQEPKSKKIQHQYPLHRISYCADDKAEKRFFSFIAKEADSDKHTCFVFVSDKLAEEITLTIGQAFDLAYKRFLTGKSVESESEKIARLERENAELRQRLRDVGSLLGKTKLAEYMEKNNIKELVLVGERELLDNQDSQEEIQEETIKKNSLDVVSEISVDSAVDTQSDKLINFDAPVTKLDTMTLDDLNDDDFDPQAGNPEGADTAESSDTSDDFNPRATPGTSNPRTISQSTPNPIIKPASSVIPQATPTRILPPPSLPPRDPSKITAAKVQMMANPFSTQAANDPFGMSNFSTGTATQVTTKDPFSSGLAFGNGDFSLDELDPLRK
eukprot:GFUD01007910.1.p1 GENE.GFUD01007910.1~~GFUD01007910.1.p1  ORF type:complete len:436 (-),score=142.84 GFUD01007910.1:381-1688(-)